MAKLEIACFNTASAHVAIEAQVDRIEFCANWEVGGLTPDWEETRALKAQTDIPIFVMIRPHGNGFVYDNDALRQMRTSLLAFKALGVDGFVFGILDERNEIDIPNNKALLALAAPLPCTFHRAFDCAHDPLAALEAVIECGFTTVLTSGAAPSAVEGIPVLQALIQRAGTRLTILPGGGVRAANIALLQQHLSADFFHSSGIRPPAAVADREEIMAMKVYLEQRR